MTMSGSLEVDKLYFSGSCGAEIGGYRGFMWLICKSNQLFECWSARIVVYFAAPLETCPTSGDFILTKRLVAWTQD